MSFKYSISMRILLLFALANAESSSIQRPVTMRFKNAVKFARRVGYRHAYRSDRWTEQKLNHYDPFDKRTWMQRYRLVDDYYVTGGPAVLLINGETDLAHLSPESSSLVMRITRESRGQLFHLEHRFYGKSRPTADSGTDNLRYLTSEQALGDIANFIDSISKKSKLTKWILCGSSYAGSLAVWAKMKYPHLVFAVIAASPPLVAEPFFTQYILSVNQTLYKYGGSGCYRALVNANKQIENLMKTNTGKRQLMRYFNICANTDLTGDDMWIFNGVMNNYIDNIVQYSKRNSLQKEPDRVYVTLDEMCDIMDAVSIGWEIERFASLVSTKRNSSSCLNVNYGSFMKHFTNVTWSQSSFTRNWYFQSCSEFGWFQTARGMEAFRNVPESFPSSICYRMFDRKFQFSDMYVDTGITNTKFGGLAAIRNLKRTVIFNGGIDPWHLLSYWTPTVNLTNCARFNAEVRITDSLGLNSIFVEGSSHAEVMGRDLQKDTFELLCSRRAILRLVDSWL